MMNSFTTFSSALVLVITLCNPTYAQGEASLLRSSPPDVPIAKEHGYDVAQFNDPLWSSQWWLQQAHYDYLYPKLPKGRPIKVALIGSGIDHTHEELAHIPFSQGLSHEMSIYGKPWLNSYFSSGNIVPCQDSNGRIEDSCSYGTSNAGLIGALPNNGKGIVGMVPNVEIIDSAIERSIPEWRELGSNVPSSIIDVIHKGAKVVIVDGFTADNIQYREAMKLAKEKNVFIVAPAGDRREQGVQLPAFFSDIMAVGAIDQFGSVPDIYARGDEIDIVAPGHNVIVPKMRNKYDRVRSTTHAATIVGATAALMLQKDPTLTPEQIKKKLTSTALAKLPGGPDRKYGHGILNIPGALDIEIPDALLKRYPPYQAVTKGGKVHRISGPSRIETAIELAKQNYSSGEQRRLILARADEFPDALGAGVLASSWRAPLLITNRDSLHPLVKAQIKDFLTDNATVTVIGGEKAISKGVIDEIMQMGFKVNRIAGADRIETSMNVAQAITKSNGVNNVVYSDAGDYATSVIAAAHAAQANGVLVLINPDAFDARVHAHLISERKPAQTFIGRKELKHDGIRSIHADDMTGLSIQVANLRGCQDQVSGIASATSFADGLTGGAHLAYKGGCFLLAYPNGEQAVSSAKQLNRFLRTKVEPRRRVIYVYGGERAIAQSFLNDVIAFKQAD